MTKKEAEREFRQYILPEVIKRYSQKDKVAMCEAWSDYTDALCKEGKITLKQYENWSNPF